MTTATSTVAEALARFRDGKAPDTTTPAPNPAPRRTGPATRTTYPRPNGQDYYARSVPGADHDIDLLRRAVGPTPQTNLHTLLAGPPGVGKTAACEAAFPGLITLECDEDTTVADFMGEWVQNPDGTWTWIDGPLPLAAENGRPFLVDELAVVSPRVQAVLHPAMDGRTSFTVKGNPRRGRVKIRPGFCVFGSYNPDTPGSRITDAVLSRFSLHIEYNTDLDLAAHLGVDERFITATKNLITKNTNGDDIWIPQMRDLLDTVTAAERYGADLAVSNFIGRAPAHDRPVVADVVSRRFGAAAVPLRTGSSDLRPPA